MAFRKVLGALAVMCLVAGCAKNPDGTTANIFSDLRAVSGSDDVSPQQEALREQAEEYRDYAKARLQGAAAAAVLGGLIGALADRNAGRGAHSSGRWQAVPRGISARRTSPATIRSSLLRKRHSRKTPRLRTSSPPLPRKTCGWRSRP